MSAAAAGLLLAAGVCGAAMGQTAPAAPSSTAASGQPAKPSADPGDKVICHYEEGDTGSLLNGRTKVCHTKREWDQMNKDARAVVDSRVDQASRPK